MTDTVALGRAATMAVQLYSGEDRVESSTDVTVGVTRADGTVVVADGTATAATGVGRYEVTLTPAQLPDVDILTATWPVTVDGVAQTRRTTLEIIGANYFELAELRAMPGLGDVAKYPTTKLAAARTAAQDEIERDVGAAFVERYGESTVTGGGNVSLRLRPYVRRILSVTSAGVALSQTELEALDIWPSGDVLRPSGVFGTCSTYRDVIVRYVHAWSDRPPTDVHDAALELARHHALGWRSFIPDDPVEADDLGRETPSGGVVDRRRGQDQIGSAIASWKARLAGYYLATSVPII